MKEIISKYKELLELKNQIEQELAVLPKGYISKKTISGKQYLYLQTRNGNTVKSKYIRTEDAEEITNQLSSRKDYEAKLPKIISRLEDIETAAELLDKVLLSKLKTLKLTSETNRISTEEIEKSRTLTF